MRFNGVLWLPPKVKERPRMGPNGHVYTPKTTLDYERELAALYDGPLFTEPISVHVGYMVDAQNVVIRESRVRRNRLRGDLDNYLKATLDALNGVAWEDDRQIVEITASFMERVEP